MVSPRLARRVAAPVPAPNDRWVPPDTGRPHYGIARDISARPPNQQTAHTPTDRAWCPGGRILPTYVGLEP